MKRITYLWVLSVCLLLSAPAFAEHGKEHGQGRTHEHGGQGIAAPASTQTNPSTPPGLAKKGKTPQGLEKQGKTPKGWTKGKKKGWEQSH